MNGGKNNDIWAAIQPGPMERACPYCGGRRLPNKETCQTYIDFMRGPVWEICRKLLLTGEILYKRIDLEKREDSGEEKQKLREVAVSTILTDFLFEFAKIASQIHPAPSYLWRLVRASDRVSHGQVSPSKAKSKTTGFDE